MPSIQKLGLGFSAGVEHGSWTSILSDKFYGSFAKPKVSLTNRKGFGVSASAAAGAEMTFFSEDDCECR